MKILITFAMSLLVLPALQDLHAQQDRTIAVDQKNSSKTEDYQHKETRDLVSLVEQAAELIRAKGQDAFAEFRAPGKPWRDDETYIFVLDSKGNMLVHPDREMAGKNQLDLKDINGKPIVRGLIDAVTALPDKSAGWYHYEWPVPGGLLPRWKSTYVQLITDPSSGARYIVGSGIYNDRMEKAFVRDLVQNAVGQIEKNGEAAFRLFHDPQSPFLVKDAYIFVVDTNGVDLVNPAFPNLEGRNILEVKDTHGKKLIREMLQTVQTRGSGWVEYMWPKPGESVSTQKSAYVTKARLGDKTVIVGCGVYLADAPKAATTAQKMTAQQLMTLVRDAAALLEQRGEKAYADFREKNSRWFYDDTYFFVWTLEGTRTLHAADPTLEGSDGRDVKDVLGRPYGRMFLEAANTASGEGWVHYMYPKPGDIFPTWKSVFVKRVNFPSGKPHLVGCGIYNMEMDEAFIKDVVNHAAELVGARGKESFPRLRDKTGPFVFMDTYVFVHDLKGNELVNGGQPSLEGKNLMNFKDVNGKFVIRDNIAAVATRDTAWAGYHWFPPGDNVPARKRTFLRKVTFGDAAYIVGSGFYPPIIREPAAAERKERKPDPNTRR